MKSVGALLLGVAHVACAQFAGPALLTRGQAPGAATMPTISFRPFVEVTGVYDTGLTAVSISDTGQLADQSAAGVRLAFGISGTHRWRHTAFAADYRGSISHYVGEHFYDTMSHSLLLGLDHTFSRRISMNLSESAGLFSRDFGLLGLPQASLIDPSTASTPITDYFDNRTIYFTSAANLIIQRSARLSLALGGKHMATRRRSKALHGVSGVMASADLQYRVSRRSTIGANYSYARSLYTKSLGSVDVHSASLAYATALSARVEFSGYFGVMRPELKSIRTVAVDPVIAALLGITQTSQVIHSVSYSPTFGGRISRKIPNGILFLGVNRGMTPGNGFFMASTSLTVTTGYSYTGLRRWSASTAAAYNRSQSLGGIVGKYQSISASARLSRKIKGSVHFVAGYSVRRYGSPDYPNYDRLVHEATIGLGFTPGEVPLRIW